ncbi:MAG: hypothetical protein H6765_02880 [Candidatus Peribacteria bacterium]|nr:MAG: hypothetical protein H6765_02880 [Candidatus Peribacteria bacterium]
MYANPTAKSFVTDAGKNIEMPGYNVPANTVLTNPQVEGNVNAVCKVNISGVQYNLLLVSLPNELTSQTLNAVNTDAIPIDLVTHVNLPNEVQTCNTTSAGNTDAIQIALMTYMNRPNELMSQTLNAVNTDAVPISLVTHVNLPNEVEICNTTSAGNTDAIQIALMTHMNRPEILMNRTLNVA